MYNQNDPLAMTRTRSGNSQRDFQDLLGNHEFQHENQKQFDFISTTNMSTIQDYSQNNYLNMDSNLASEMNHMLEFAEQTKQGNTHNVTNGNTLAILNNTNEFNNNVPITPVPNNQMNQEWGIIKNAPEPVQGIIQETIVLPPLQNCPKSMDKHPIEKTNSNVPSRALVPKNWKMTEDVAARIIKPSLSKDKITLKEDTLFKTKHSIKKTKIGVSTTSSSKAASMPRVIKTKSTQTEYNLKISKNHTRLDKHLAVAFQANNPILGREEEIHGMEGSTISIPFTLLANLILFTSNNGKKTKER